MANIIEGDLSHIVPDYAPVAAEDLPAVMGEGPINGVEQFDSHTPLRLNTDTGLFEPVADEDKKGKGEALIEPNDVSSAMSPNQKIEPDIAKADAEIEAEVSGDKPKARKRQTGE